MGEVFLELVFNLIGGILEVFADALIGDFTWPDSKASRIFWAIVLVFLGGLIWWELR
jgi:hypothetical protein